MNCETEIYLIAVVFLVCTHVIKIGRVFVFVFLPLIANILFDAINFTLEKVFETFFRPNELPKIKLFNDHKWNIFCNLIAELRARHANL